MRLRIVLASSVAAALQACLHKARSHVPRYGTAALQACLHKARSYVPRYGTGLRLFLRVAVVEGTLPGRYRILVLLARLCKGSGSAWVRMGQHPRTAGANV